MSDYNPEDLKGTARELAFDVERLEAALIKAELALRNQPPPTRVIELEATFDRIAVAMGCEPEDNADLVEAVRLLVQERDAAVQRAERAERLYAEAEDDLARLSVQLIDAQVEAHSTRRPAVGSPGLVGTGCVECGGTCLGHVYDAALLAWRETLGANLATAGALCRAYRVGFDSVRPTLRGCRCD